MNIQICVCVCVYDVSMFAAKRIRLHRGHDNKILAHGTHALACKRCLCTASVYKLYQDGHHDDDDEITVCVYICGCVCVWERITLSVSDTFVFVHTHRCSLAGSAGKSNKSEKLHRCNNPKKTVGVCVRWPRNVGQNVRMRRRTHTRTSPDTDSP